MLEAFHAGELRQAALVWDAIERRDDVLQGLVAKRKKSIARLDWEVVCLEDSELAHAHQDCLIEAYQGLEADNGCDLNVKGGLRLLLQQMMDAVGKRYAVHQLELQPRLRGAQRTVQVKTTFVPLWYFENTTGQLGYLGDRALGEGDPLAPEEWMVTTGEGLMESSSIAYLFKHLPLRDWLVYCERNGMPGVKGVTDFAPGSPEWEEAKAAVADFGAEFHALMSRGTDIEAIDISTSGELPYPRLIERMDRALIALWRGSDLGTLSSKQGMGSSLQSQESALIEETDAAQITETLNRQLDRWILRKAFNTDYPKAHFRLKPRDHAARQADLNLYQALLQMGLPLSRSAILKRFGLTQPTTQEDTLQ